jgi:hypothetical protein
MFLLLAGGEVIQRPELPLFAVGVLGPDALVPVGTHLIEPGPLALHDIAMAHISS